MKHTFKILEDGIEKFREVEIPEVLPTPEPIPSDDIEEWYAFLPALKISKGSLTFSPEG